MCFFSLHSSLTFTEVEVVGDLVGNAARVIPLGAEDTTTPQRVDARPLAGLNLDGGMM